jgi:hypothetical protein
LARTKTTVKPEIKILEALMFNTELEQYHMPKKTKLSYRTILRILCPMKKVEYIRLVRTEPSKKGGKEKKIYAITLIGLLRYLSSTVEKLGESEFDVIAAAHPDLLPLIFGKWDFFNKNNVKNIIFNGLIDFVKNRLPGLPAIDPDYMTLKVKFLSNFEAAEKALPNEFKQTDKFKKLIKGIEERKKEYLEDAKMFSLKVANTLNVYVLLKRLPEENNVLFPVFRTDPELNLFVTETLRNTESALKISLKDTKAGITYWESLKGETT